MAPSINESDASNAGLPSRRPDAGEVPSPCFCPTVLWIALGTGFCVWCVTWGSISGSAAMVQHYAALGVVIAAAAALVFRRWCSRSRTCCVAAVIAVVVLPAYSMIDRYTQTWTMVYVPDSAEWVRTDEPLETRDLSPDGRQVKKYVDYYRRWSGDHFYRTMELYRADSSSPVPDSAAGPMVEGQPHGHWVFTTWHPHRQIDRWYWHGREVSQGRWPN